MPIRNFNASFRDAIEKLHSDAEQSGIAMSEICEIAGVSRATPHRYLKKIPATIAAVTRMQSALARLKVAKAGPCAKMTVTATIIAENGEKFVGTNCCSNPVMACPRAGMPTGVGYEKCIEVCRQVGHAEIVALNLAGDSARGAVLYVEGHSYACDACKAAAYAAGIRDITIGPPPA